MAGEWLAQVPEDLRTNEAITEYATLGDFVKSHLEVKGKLNEFDGKVKSYEGEIETLKQNSIPKLPENPTPEQVVAYKTAIGVPEKPDGYEFKPAEGITHDPAMINFARDIFYKAGLNKEQAGVITQGWDAFMAEMEKGQMEEVKAAKDKAEADLKKELGDQYPEAVALSGRLWQKHMGADFKDFLEQTKLQDGTAMGNHPLLIRFFTKLAKLTGEDKTPPSTSTGPKPGEAKMVYDKSPAPPKSL